MDDGVKRMAVDSLPVSLEVLAESKAQLRRWIWWIFSLD
jgi:hypothetical protein